MPVVVLATRNSGKIAELRAMLAPFALEVKGLDAFPQIGEIEETGATFEANALLKARAVAQAAGCVAVADDSGLEVDALGGAPGVRSARYSGAAGPEADRANWEKVLAALQGIPEDRRGARFRCAVAAATPDGRELTAQGAWEGRIALAPAGEGGFGYDPVFLDLELDCTAAQLTPEQKNARSHRGKALQELLRLWPDFLADGKT